VDTSPALATWIRAGSHVALLGEDIFIRTAVTPGRPPLLLVHGYPTASYDWHRLWPALADRYSLYALDLLGFGLSAKPQDATYPIALQADLCEALLARFGLDRPHVLAHD
jgi:pimeloyl-ACP methyl ester carboxylesterase